MSLIPVSDMRIFRHFSSAAVTVLALLTTSLTADDDARVHDLGQFVVTGTRTERLLTEAPVKTELYTRAEVEDFHFTSVREALTLVPAARFEADCQNCGLNQIQLLGLSTDYTAILFDGAPLYSGVAKVYGADLFPAIFIDRIEVVKGGSSVLYGPEAIAGVVNLITSAPLETQFESRVVVERIDNEGNAWEASVRADYVASGGGWAATAYAFDDGRVH